MKKLARISSLLLAAIIATSALSGCEGQQAGGNTNTAALTDLKTDEFFPLKQGITVKMVGVRSEAVAPMSEVAYFKELEKKTNMKIDWIDWTQTVQKEKTSLMFASGDLPDALYGSWVLLTPSDAVRYGSEGFLMDLNIFINDTHMPNVNKLFKDTEGMRAALTSPEGGLYALPTLDVNTLRDTNDTLVINKDWLAKVNKPMPKTIDEFVDVLTAFKNSGDLNGNGKQDEIPFGVLYNDGNQGAYGLMGFTGIPAQNRNVRMVMKNNEPKYFQAIDEYKEYLIFLNKLYTSGLIDKEMFTMDAPAYTAKSRSNPPVYGVMSTWDALTINNIVTPKNDTTKDGTYVFLEPMKGPSGVEPKWGKRITPYNGNLSFAISSKTKYPEEMARWADLQYDPATSLKNYVTVSDDYTKHEGGNKYSRVKDADGKFLLSTKAFDISKVVPRQFAVAWIKKGAYEWTDAVVSAQDKLYVDKLYAPYIEQNYVNTYVMTSVEESSRMSFLQADIFTYADQMTADFVTKGNIEARWGDYIKQLKNLGLDEYEKITTEIHNRSKK